MKKIIAFLLLITCTAHAEYLQVSPVARGGTGLASLPAAGQLLIGNSGGTAYALQLMSGDFTMTAGGVATIGPGAVTPSKMANVNAHSYLGNNTGTSASPADISSTQLTADLNAFTSSLQGMAPASGGGSVNFLRADGTWAAPAGSGSVTSVSVVSANGLAGTVATATSTPAITLSTTVTGVLKGNGTAISAATANTDYQAPLSFTAPLVDTTNTVTCNAASGSQPGCLASADWTTFNNKENVLWTVTDGGNAAYAIQSAPADQHVRATTTLTGNQTYTLPACTGSNIGERHEVKNPPAQGFQIIVAAAGSDNIDGSANVPLNPGDSLPVICSAFAAAGTWDAE